MKVATQCRYEGIAREIVNLAAVLALYYDSFSPLEDVSRFFRGSEVWLENLSPYSIDEAYVLSRRRCSTEKKQLSGACDRLDVIPSAYL